jgi:hypothetical protein
LIPNSPEWIGTVTGALMDLIYSSNWTQTTGITPDEAAERANLMFNLYLNSGNDGECGDMACCPPDVFIFRINPDNGTIEQSPDNGTTWTPAANTLSSTLVNPVPPVTSGTSATKCDAATNVSAQVNAWIAQVTADFDTATSLVEFATAVFEAILAAVLAFLSAGTLTAIEALIIPMLGAALSAAWSAGKAAFEAYWTTTNKDIVLCAAFCNIGDDGSFTDAQFSAFWMQCNTDLPAGPAKILFMGFLSSIGTSGLNVMAATGLSADSDCGSCGCGSCGFGTWGFYDGSAGTTITKTDSEWNITANLRDDGNYYVIIISSGSDDCCHINPLDTNGDALNDIGTGRSTSWCGEVPTTVVEGNHDAGGGSALNPWNGVLLRSNAPFTVGILTA